MRYIGNKENIIRTKTFWIIGIESCNIFIVRLEAGMRGLNFMIAWFCKTFFLKGVVYG